VKVAGIAGVAAPAAERQADRAQEIRLACVVRPYHRHDVFLAGKLDDRRAGAEAAVVGQLYVF
jgi:hypothetical protein